MLSTIKDRKAIQNVDHIKFKADGLLDWICSYYPLFRQTSMLENLLSTDSDVNMQIKTEQEIDLLIKNKTAKNRQATIQRDRLRDRKCTETHRHDHGGQ